MGTIIGRKKEQKELQKLFDMNKSILLAVYVRRRVGKTYLINEFFDGEFTFKQLATIIRRSQTVNVRNR